MRTSELNASHLGVDGVFPIDGGTTATGTLTRVRHSAGGTYIELDHRLGVFLTDTTREITS